MTNKDIVTNWKTLGILLDGDPEVKPLAKHFMLCLGECQDELELNDGSKKKVVIFDTGGEMGSPSLWCHSDDQDNCWEVGFDPKTEKSTEIIIGKFVSI